jgi:(2Fe-2S) ferredoxin
VSSHSMKIIDTFNEELVKHSLDKEVRVVQTGCFGLCEAGPIVIVYPEGAFYSMIKVSDVSTIVEEHLMKGRLVTDLLYKDHTTSETMNSIDEVGFYKKQKRVALRNCGVINPEVIEEYIAYDGYQALAKVLTEMTPEEVVDTMLNVQVCEAVAAADFPPA